MFERNNNENILKGIKIYEADGNKLVKQSTENFSKEFGCFLK